MNLKKFIKKEPVLRDVKDLKETVWINPNKILYGDKVWQNIDLDESDRKDAEKTAKEWTLKYASQ